MHGLRQPHPHPPIQPPALPRRASPRLLPCPRRAPRRPQAHHWMWFIFPQIAGLGSSDMAQHFAISGRAEALAYLAHPILGPRLRECTELVNQVPQPHHRRHLRLSRRPQVPLLDHTLRRRRAQRNRLPRRARQVLRRRIRPCNARASLNLRANARRTDASAQPLAPSRSQSAPAAPPLRFR